MVHLFPPDTNCCICLVSLWLSSVDAPMSFANWKEDCIYGSITDMKKMVFVVEVVYFEPMQWNTKIKYDTELVPTPDPLYHIQLGMRKIILACMYRPGPRLGNMKGICWWVNLPLMLHYGGKGCGLLHSTQRSTLLCPTNETPEHPSCHWI